MILLLDEAVQHVVFGGVKCECSKGVHNFHTGITTEFIKEYNVPTLAGCIEQCCESDGALSLHFGEDTYDHPHGRMQYICKNCGCVGCICTLL